MRKKGFTLIELLIVVAIIAILAAIAVPNFLEAQTRAKVSRAKADIRTLAVGIEEYLMEWNFPPVLTEPNMWDWRQILKKLTTPVAYLSSLQIEDPFGSRATDRPNRSQFSYMQFYTSSKLAIARQIHGYCFRSNGPDRHKGRKLQGILNHDLTWEEVETAGVPSPWYDPSNGTVSLGDIIRTRAILDGLPAGILDK